MEMEKVEKFLKEKFEEKLKDNPVYLEAKGFIEHYSKYLSIFNEQEFDIHYRNLSSDFYFYVEYTASMVIEQKLIKRKGDKRKQKLLKKKKRASADEQNKIDEKLAEIDNNEKYKNAIEFVNDYNYFQKCFKDNDKCLNDARLNMIFNERQVAKEVMLENLNSEEIKDLVDQVIIDSNNGASKTSSRYKFSNYARSFFSSQLEEMNKAYENKKVKEETNKLYNFVSSQNVKEEKAETEIEM